MSSINIKKIIGVVPAELVFPHVRGIKNSNKKRTASFFGYDVNVSSKNIVTFKKNPTCVCCGCTGEFFVMLDCNDRNPHFNFCSWGEDRIIFMTRDHIIPRTKGGGDGLGNSQTMCSVCNELKSNHDYSINELRAFRSNYVHQPLTPTHIDILLAGFGEVLIDTKESDKTNMKNNTSYIPKSFGYDMALAFLLEGVRVSCNGVEVKLGSDGMIWNTELSPTVSVVPGRKFDLIK